MKIKSNIVNVITDEIYPAEVEIKDGHIKAVTELNRKQDTTMIPGLIDAHIHIESSMLVPTRFAQTALKHGTTSVITDPHEIANVMGIEGINYMINDSKNTPLNVYFTVPSCVPSTKYETNGATLDSKITDELLSKKEFIGLSEVMDYNAVLNDEEEIIKKIESAKKYNKAIDGHAPLLRSTKLQKYISAGITTDHESITKEEVIEKKRLGMKIMIREGSESKTLKEFINLNPDFIVTDDLKAEELVKGHLNTIIQKAVKLGYDIQEILKLVTINPAQHYQLNTGSITPGRKADLVILDNLEDFNIKEVISSGIRVCRNNQLLINPQPQQLTTKINVKNKTPEDFEIRTHNKNTTKALVNVIKVTDNQIVTDKITREVKVKDGKIETNTEDDTLKISVVERYGHNTIYTALINGFGITNGAISSSVAHDSHNIITIGTNSKLMAKATNTVIDNNGGLAAVDNNETISLKLEVAGLMTKDKAEKVAEKSSQLNEYTKIMGSKLTNPFSTLSFMALPVVPALKITDKGLFDVDENRFIP
ncbi:MAG: adenine deaminase, partial [Methanosphaera sp. rholeuAM74]